VATDSRQPRDGSNLEELGYYHPLESSDKGVSLKADRIKEWLSRGALPSSTVKKLLNKYLPG
jgi:small subunit ribosomal protein S16